jgi:hypothetical protein
MPKLLVKVPGEPETELDLPPGIYQVGRSPGANFQINHPSVSGSHCQITVEAAGAAIKDLGSTNGTWIDGRRIQEQPLRPGQSLRLGQVDLVFDPQAPPPTGLHLASTPAVAVAAGPPAAPPLPARLAEPRPAAPPAGSFSRSIPGAFIYPLKRSGFILLAAGSVFFLVFNLLPAFQRVAASLALSGGLGRGFLLFLRMMLLNPFLGLWVIFTALVTGYVFLFMQSIISASAIGENRMPSFPPFESWWDDAALPYLRLLGILACCLAPAVLCREYLGPGVWLLTLLLGILGFCYFSMALLAVTICDSMLALDPRLVVASIWRIPGQYGAYCLLFLLLMAATFASPRWIRQLPIPLLRYPIYQHLLAQFFFLYISAVQMRLLGLLYHTGRQRLGWKL